MTVEDAQREMREVYLNGSVGGFVSGTLWLVAAALGAWVSPRAAMLGLFFGGALIFPVMQLVLLAMGRRTTLSPANPLASLARQIAFIVPLGFPLVFAAALYRIDWFFPAAMIVVGAHYLPFTFLYGLRVFQPLGYALVAGGLMLGLYGPREFALGGWITGAILVGYGCFAGVTARGVNRQAQAV